MVGGGGMHGGGDVWQGGMCGRGAMRGGGMHGRGACVAGGHAWQEGMCGGGHAWWLGVCVAGKMTITVGSMHPTGMHSCLARFLPKTAMKMKDKNAFQQDVYCPL